MPLLRFAEIMTLGFRETLPSPAQHREPVPETDLEPHRPSSFIASLRAENEALHLAQSL